MAKTPTQNVQDVFLGHVRRGKAPVTIFLVNGVKLQGVISWFDDETVLLRRDGHTQLVYKHAISTVMPLVPVNVFEAPNGSASVTSGTEREATLQAESDETLADDIY
ncbi:RNA-binding protein Hfq [Acetobacter estunensis NRIC 0472]|uniref:RNA-binding protein Hfq n=1 Tax=Acetobacter estunensis TaxID=104097 RepID=A0A967B5C7_9PROT|nr:RNA chaperone Hfq [Acetobacter estunensis]NHO53100.1 RNA chaperone Hfq [Acetobacter estunensis]GBQ24702.1 RNA-binding protein Hfq [Acetobacter estunensis NRIC 0472]